MSIYFPKMSAIPAGGFPKTRQGVPLRELISKYSVIAVDRYGVTMTSTAPIPGAYETLQRIQATGKIIAVWSNTATTLPEDVQKAWQKAGISVPLKWIFTSGMALATYIQHHRLQRAPIINLGNQASAWYIETAGACPILPDNLRERYRTAEAVVVGGDTYKFSKSELDLAISAILAKNIPFVLTTSDELIPRTETEVGIGGACAAVLLRRNTGKEPIVIGKPARGMYDLLDQALEREGIPKQSALIIGDDLYADIWGANNASYDSFLVDTGISGQVRQGVIRGFVAQREKRLIKAGICPTYHLPSMVI